jgi:hypothetical protein
MISKIEIYFLVLFQKKKKKNQFYITVKPFLDFEVVRKCIKV